MGKNIKDEILRILSKPTTVTEIKRKLPKVKSFGSISYHLKNLEREGVITKEKETKKQGQPTKYKLNSPGIKKRIKEFYDQKKKYKIAFLNQIKQNPMKEDAVVTNELENAGFNYDIIKDISMDSENEKLAVFCWKITQKGEKFLKENSK